MVAPVSGEDATTADRSAIRKTLLPLLGAGLIYAALSLTVGAAANGSRFASAVADVWRALVSAQGVVWAAALWLNRADLARAFRTVVGWLYAGLILVALALPTLVDELSPVKAVFVKPKFSLLPMALQHFLTGFVLVGSLVASAISALVGVTLFELLRGKPSYVTLVEARQRLQRGMTTLSILLVAAVGTTSWLQRSFEAMEKGTYAKETVFTYGLYFSVLLLAVYLPAIAEFYRAAASMTEATFPMPLFDKAQAAQRSALLKELGATKSDGLQAAFATLSPIISAIVSVSLGKE